MRKRSIWLGALITLLAAGIGIFTDWRIGSGFILGAVFSLWLYWRTVAFCDRLLKMGNTSKKRTYGRFLTSYVLMAIPLLTAVRFPEFFNLFAAAAGLLLIKIVLLIDSLLERREKDGQSNSSDDSDRCDRDHRINGDIVPGDHSAVKEDR